MLSPIEAYLRVNENPDEWVRVIRGRPLSTDALLAAAARTRAEFSWRAAPLAAVSAEVTGPNVTTQDVLAGRRLRTRRNFASAAVADVIGGGFALLATFSAPHISIVLPKYDDAHVRKLLEILGPEQPNEFFERSLG